jgi:transposase
VYFVSDLIDALDLSAITAVYEEEERGYPPYHPVMLTKVLVYGYCVGVFSSRRIQRRLIEDIPFRVLAAGNQPDFRTIADFRKIHLTALRGLFEQVLQMARDLGALRVGRVALDGSKVKANASKHKAMSYDRMGTKTRQVREEVRQLLAQADAADAAEDATYGADRHGDELPAELQRRESRLKRIREAKRALEARAKEEAAATGQPGDTVKPDPKAQYNFTDPESRIMKASNKGWDQCGNAQAVTDEHQIILAADVTEQANDVRQMVPMVDQARANLDAAGVKEAIKAALGDAGYYSETNATDLKQRGIEPYLATERLKHHEKVASAPRGRIPQGLSAKQRMARKLRTKKGREMYSKRKGMIEPIFGQLKQVLGFRQFSLRGLASMRGEWRLMATVHNLLKLWRRDQRMEMAG